MNEGDSISMYYTYYVCIRSLCGKQGVLHIKNDEDLALQLTKHDKAILKEPESHHWTLYGNPSSTMMSRKG